MHVATCRYSVNMADAVPQRMHLLPASVPYAPLHSVHGSGLASELPGTAGRFGQVSACPDVLASLLLFALMAALSGLLL